MTVKENSGTTSQYKWDKDGEYEIELCAIPGRHLEMPSVSFLI